jgi:hypothetical protein
VADVGAQQGGAMGPVTRSAVKQRAAVSRVRSAVEIDMPPGSGGGGGGGNGAANGDAPSDDAARTSLHWSDGGSSGGGSDEDGAVSGKARGGRSRRRGGGGGGSGGDAIAPYEWGNMALLVLLYAMQGIPLGLTMGTM